MDRIRSYRRASIAFVGLLVVLSVTFAVVLSGCRAVIHTDAAGQPTGDVTWTASESGEMEAVAMAPDGTTTPVQMDVEPDTEAIGAALQTGGGLLGGPWGLGLGLLGGFLRTRKA